MWEQKEVSELKVNRYVNIDDEPCRIVSISTSKPGKHGGAKARIEGIGLFTGSKRTLVSPVKAKVQVPMINKRRAQVLSIANNEVQLMDLETYETVTLPIPDDLESPLKEGSEVMYMEAMGRQRLL
ncbi:MAG: translation initiation factor [Candidatus Methanomethylophilaceae archaeon]|nr:MAG: Translation initiation factor 5A (EIF-5A) [Thermoplasmatales archaeon 49_6]MDI3482588.1 translation initiation factor [Candidatus Methanomethylophilaceae archaeon]MDI3541471.1 translation initiation factor [Candidatus Methanomethylophilaceae archaeon]